MIDEQLCNFISNFGFPIAAFILMFYFANKTLKENTKAIYELTKIVGDCINRK